MSSRSAVEKRLATLRPSLQLIEETCYAKTTTPLSFGNLSDSRDGWFTRYSTISTIVYRVLSVTADGGALIRVGC